MDARTGNYSQYSKMLTVYAPVEVFSLSNSSCVKGFKDIHPVKTRRMAMMDNPDIIRFI